MKNNVKSICEGNVGFGLFEQAKSYALAYMKNLQDRPIFPSEADINCLDIFEEKLPDTSADPVVGEIFLRRLPGGAGSDGGYFHRLVRDRRLYRPFPDVPRP